MRVNLKTLGCRLNEAELETWAQQLQAEGHRIVADGSEADLVILNSCAVTEDAVKKSRYLIRKSHRENPTAKLVVSGCYASLENEEVAQTLGVDLVVGNADKSRLVEIVRERLDLKAMPSISTEPGEFALFTLGRQRAFIKVQDGCRYRCTFCIVTVARGEETSRPIADVIDEVNTLHGQGIQEMVLTGVHLGGWGSDLGLRLPDLIQALLEHTDVPRLRIGSLEPWELDEDFLAILGHPRVMPHLHLPLQSGSDSVLRRMARRCKTAEYAALAASVRSANPDMNITTDIIVGFPGETEAEWAETLAFVEAKSFGHIHIFSYSPRPGTKAATLPEPVSTEIKKARSQSLHQIAYRQRQSVMQKACGKVMPVLWERGQQSDREGYRRHFGYTPNYLKVAAEAPDAVDLSSRIVTARLDDVDMSGDFVWSRLEDFTPVSGPDNTR
jgi:threonylcarbamoyladenosine tRNA methylthiotransferase MtaB